MLRTKKIGRFDYYRSNAFMGFDMPPDPAISHFHISSTRSKSKSMDRLFSNDSPSTPTLIQKTKQSLRCVNHSVKTNLETVESGAVTREVGTGSSTLNLKTTKETQTLDPSDCENRYVTVSALSAEDLIDLVVKRMDELCMTNKTMEFNKSEIEMTPSHNFFQDLIDTRLMDLQTSKLEKKSFMKILKDFSSNQSSYFFSSSPQNAPGVDSKDIAFVPFDDDLSTSSESQNQDLSEIQPTHDEVSEKKVENDNESTIQSSKEKTADLVEQNQEATLEDGSDAKEIKDTSSVSEANDIIVLTTPEKNSMPPTTNEADSFEVMNPVNKDLSMVISNADSQDNEPQIVKEIATKETFNISSCSQESVNCQAVEIAEIDSVSAVIVEETLDLVTHANELHNLDHVNAFKQEEACMDLSSIYIDETNDSQDIFEDAQDSQRVVEVIENVSLNSEAESDNETIVEKMAEQETTEASFHQNEDQSNQLVENQKESDDVKVQNDESESNAAQLQSTLSENLQKIQRHEDHSEFVSNEIDTIPAVVQEPVEVISSTKDQHHSSDEWNIAQSLAKAYSDENIDINIKETVDDENIAAVNVVENPIDSECQLSNESSVDDPIEQEGNTEQFENEEEYQPMKSDETNKNFDEDEMIESLPTHPETHQILTQTNQKDDEKSRHSEEVILEETETVPIENLSATEQVVLQVENSDSQYDQQQENCAENELMSDKEEKLNVSEALEETEKSENIPTGTLSPIVNPLDQHLIPAREENLKNVKRSLVESSSDLENRKPLEKPNGSFKKKRDFIAENIQKISSPVELKSNVNTGALFCMVNPFAVPDGPSKKRRADKCSESSSVSSVVEMPSPPRNKSKNKNRNRNKSPSKVQAEQSRVSKSAGGPQIVKPVERPRDSKSAGESQNTKPFETAPSKKQKRANRKNASNDKFFNEVGQKLAEHCANQDEMKERITGNLQRMNCGIQQISQIHDEIAHVRSDFHNEVSENLRQEVSRVAGMSSKLSKEDD